MLKVISLNFQNTIVDFLFYQYDNNEKRFRDKTKFHKHMNFEIHFALNGFYEYEFTDRKILLNKNQMLIIPPGILHKAVDISNSEYEFKILTLKFSSKEADGFYNFFASAFRQRALESIELQDEIINNVLSLYPVIDAKTYLQSIYLTSRASKVFYDLCDLLTYDKDKCSYETEDHLDVKIENLVNNFNMSLTDIATEINYSPRQTERLIKRIYGKSLTKIREDFK